MLRSTHRRATEAGLYSVSKMTYSTAWSPVTPQVRLQHFYEEFKGSLYTTSRLGGDTYLHYLAQSGRASDIDKFIGEVGEENAAAMAKMTNDQGHLPIDVVSEREEKEAFRSKLYALMRVNAVKPLSEPLNVDEILSGYTLSSQSQLRSHLKIACSIVNEARSAIRVSSAHPQTNFYSEERKKQVFDRVTTMRNATDKAIGRLASNDIADRIHVYADIAQEYSAGNCAEFSCYVWSRLSKAYGESFSEIYRLGNGDHMFVVMDRGAQSNASRYQTWKKEALVCDVATGKIFLASELERELTAHRLYTLDDKFTIHSQVSFNPNFHYLEAEVSLVHRAQQREKGVESLLGCGMGLFSRQNKDSDSKVTEALSDECRKSAYFI